MEQNKQGRNLRKFLLEFGTIVLGVSVALAAQQIAEWWRWRAEVAQAKHVIASEMARNVTFGIERMLAARCLRIRLEALEKVVNTASRTGNLPPLGRIVGPPLQPWSDGAWESVVASQTATHFPSQELATLSLTYRQIERLETWNRQEGEAWTLLFSLSGPGSRLDPPYEAELRKALSLGFYFNNVIAQSSERQIRRIESLNLTYSADERQQMADRIKGKGLFTDYCAPIGTVADAHRAPSEQTLSRVEGFMRSLPYGQAAQ